MPPLEPPIKSGQQVKEFLDVLLLPSETTIVKTEVHATRDNMEVKRNALTDHFAK